MKKSALLVAWAVLFVCLPDYAAERNGRRVYVLAAAGVSGDRAHREKFRALLTNFRRAALDRLGLRPENVVLLLEEGAEPDGMAQARSTKKMLSTELLKLSKKVGRNDIVVIFLAGHADRIMGKVKWHLPGPDVSPTELAEMLRPFKKGRLVVIVATPLSGYFMNPLKGKRRVVITATLAAAEVNETYFPYAFVEAVLDPKTDTDADGRVSVLEIFRAAKVRVAEFFKQKKLMQTEHAMLDDNGDGLGSTEITDKSLDGKSSREISFQLKVEL